jgi:hypothetical protein
MGLGGAFMSCAGSATAAGSLLFALDVSWVGRGGATSISTQPPSMLNACRLPGSVLPPRTPTQVEEESRACDAGALRERLEARLMQVSSLCRLVNSSHEELQVRDQGTAGVLIQRRGRLDQRSRHGRELLVSSMVKGPHDCQHALAASTAPQGMRNCWNETQQPAAVLLGIR